MHPDATEPEGSPPGGVAPDAEEPLAVDDVPPPGQGRQQDERAPGRGPSALWAGIRAVLMLFLATLSQALVLFGIMVIVDIARPLDGRIKPEELARHVGVMFAAYVPAIALILLAWRYLDRGSLAQIGLPGPPTRIVRGLGLGALGGALFMALIVGTGIAAGGWRVTFFEGDSTLAWLGWTPFLVIAATFEELLLRGYCLQNLGRRSPWLGLILSSIVFSLLHLANPNAGAGSSFTAILVAEIFLAGVLLGALYLLSGDLWLPTGVHVGWNWAQGILFGLPTSGIDIPSIGQGEVLETSLLTGSQFGPESSLVALAFTAVAAAACLVLLARRGARLPLHSASGG